MSETAHSRLKKIYSTAAFDAAWTTVGERASELLHGAFSRERNPLVWKSPRDAEALAKSLLVATSGSESEQTKRLENVLQVFLTGVNALQSPRCMGHQVAPPIPLASVLEGLGATFNQGSGVYEVGPGSNGAERALVTALAEQIGWGGESSGFFTHGGSAANMTAIAAARSHRFPAIWDKGVGAVSEVPCVLVSEQAHYSMARACAILGLGAENVVKVSVDARRKIQPEAVRAAVEKAKAAGKTPFMLVASSGTTSVGAFDPLDTLAATAKELGLWFHIDGAHGASVLFSNTHRPLCKGIELADSVTWDAHKMLFAPALSTALLFREKRNSFLAFNQDAPYLFSPGSEMGTDGAERTLECTRRALALATWGAWSVYGSQVFSDLIDVTFGTTKEFHRLLTEAPDFEPLHEPEGNILCFRHLPASLRAKSEEEQGLFQSDLREKVVRAGRFYLTRSKLENQPVLRVTIMNPLTEQQDLIQFLDELRSVGRTP